MTAKPKVMENLKRSWRVLQFEVLKRVQTLCLRLCQGRLHSVCAPYVHAYLCVASQLTDFQKQTKRESFPVPKGALS